MQAKRSSRFRLDPNGDSFSEMLGGICTNWMFLTGATYLMNVDGSRADVATGVYNHYVAVMDIGKPIELGIG